MNRRALSGIRIVDLAELARQLFSKLFSEVRLLTRLKLAAFTSFLMFVGLGFVLRVSALDFAWTNAVVEFTLASPSTGQVIGAFAALVFVIGANIYAQNCRREWQLKMLELAAKETTPEGIRQHILRATG